MSEIGCSIKENVVPEGPELAHSCDVLRKQVVGKNFDLISYYPSGRYREKRPIGCEEFCNETSVAATVHNSPTQIKDVGVKGKFMWWEFDVNGTEWFLFCSYGMTGQWLSEETDHATAMMNLIDPQTESSSSIFFTDQRNFGTLRFVKGRKALDAKLKTLGPDMLNDPPSTAEFQERLRKKNDWNICKALMNQGVVSGVGNYVKCESLYRAGIDPNVNVKDLDDFALHRLCAKIIEVMEESYQSKGASFDTYRNPDGSKGKSSFSFRCYGRKKDEYGNPIEKVKTPDGRSTWWCPAVQRE